jgi:predicted amidohydrolase
MILAPAQVGRHGPTRRTWGHTLAVDGWGKVLAENADAVAALKVRVDSAGLQTVREQMPVLRHNRFQTSLIAPSDPISSNEE